MNTRELASPERLTSADRALEIATILGLAILRTHADEGHSESTSDLAFSPGKGLHTTPSQQGDA